ncbi:hypothetical protein ACQKFL_16820 [Vreelandella titanicae]|mgnify:CR=1 FL=1|uniref:hypothetical protein n=1 Tax=Vreelandella titanicae TaxID=664683 RepID=UPI003CFC8D01|tara:strand:- start:578 stop:901 length:324 start_codon:yes stop_codon:yes gene_type:complete
MRTTLMFTAFAAFLMGSSTVYGNSPQAEAAIHEVDCSLSADLAEMMMLNRLDGVTKAEAESRMSLETESQSDIPFRETLDLVYSKDIDDISIENYREKYFQECMSEG